MSYRVLARTYRPERFDEVRGQDHVIEPLTRSIENDRVGHAYIFSGPRGIGKTTTARLLAKRVNCEQPYGPEPCNDCRACEEITDGSDVDVLEIDGASNNGVDQIRELREQVQYAPAQNRKKVYIIDEVHMLSDAAFNALLKTLEEPPDHAMFIFATTEIDQVPDTILSRCQRFNFRLLSLQDLVKSLEFICDQESIPAEQDALYLIAKFAEGSLRDAQSILDQMINFTDGGDQPLTGGLVSDTWGLASYEELSEMLAAIVDGEDETLLERLDEHLASGNDLMLLINDLTEMMRHLVVLKRGGDSGQLSSVLPDHVLSTLRELTGDLRTTELTWMFDELIDLTDQLQRHTRFQRELAEVGLVRILRGRPRYDLNEMIDRLEALEDGEPETTRGTTTSKTDSSRQTTTSSKKPGPTSNESAEETTKDLDDPGDDAEPASSPEPEQPEPPEQAAESTESDASKDRADWGQLLEAIPHPTRAYLQEAEQADVGAEELLIQFDSRWRNHVDQLREEKRVRTIREACEQVLGYEPEVTIELMGEEESESATVESDSDDDPEPEDPSNNDQQPSLVERAKQEFDVESVERID